MKNGCTEDGENVGPLLCKRVCRITRIGALCTPSETIPPMVVIPRYPLQQCFDMVADGIDISLLCRSSMDRGIVNGLKRTKMKKVRFEYYLEFFFFKNRYQFFRTQKVSSVLSKPYPFECRR